MSFWKYFNDEATTDSGINEETVKRVVNNNLTKNDNNDLFCHNQKEYCALLVSFPSFDESFDFDKTNRSVIIDTNKDSLSRHLILSWAELSERLCEDHVSVSSAVRNIKEYKKVCPKENRGKDFADKNKNKVIFTPQDKRESSSKNKNARDTATYYLLTNNSNSEELYNDEPSMFIQNTLYDHDDADKMQHSRDEAASTVASKERFGDERVVDILSNELKDLNQRWTSSISGRQRSTPMETLYIDSNIEDDQVFLVKT